MAEDSRRSKSDKSKLRNYSKWFHESQSSAASSSSSEDSSSGSSMESIGRWKSWEVREAKRELAFTSKVEKSLFDTIPTDGMKSDVFFDIISKRAHLEPDYFDGRFHAQFNFTKNDKLISSWTIDTKTGDVRVYRSKAKEKPGLNVFIDDEDFSHIMYGLYENRPIVNDIVKVEGSMAMLLRLDSFWFRIRVIHRDPVLRIAKKPFKAGLRSELVMFAMIDRIHSTELFPERVWIQIHITKDRSTEIYWLLQFDDFGKLHRVFREDSPFPKSELDLRATLCDTDFVYLVLDPSFKFQTALDKYRIKCQGDANLIHNLGEMFRKSSSNKTSESTITMDREESTKSRK